MNSLNSLIKRLTIWIVVIILIIIILYTFELLNDVRIMKKKKKNTKPITNNLNENKNLHSKQRYNIIETGIKKITFMAVGNLSNVSGMYVETHKKRRLIKSKTFYSPIEGVQNNTLLIEPCEILKIIILLKPKGVITKFIHYDDFEHKQIIKIENKNGNVGVDKQINNSLGIGNCSLYNPQCCLIDTVCNNLIGDDGLTETCEDLLGEWIGECELAGGGPEDPFADVCAAGSAAVSIACEAAVDAGLDFTQGSCKKVFDCR